MQRFILILLTGLFWSNVSSAEFKLPNQDYSEIKSVYSYGDKKLIVVSEETFESIWIYDPLTNKQTRVKNVWNFIDYTSRVVSYKKSEFDLKPRLAVITEKKKKTFRDRGSGFIVVQLKSCRLLCYRTNSRSQ